MIEREILWIDWIIISLYVLSSIIIGTWFSKRAGRNTEEYFLSGRKLSWWIAGTAMVATTFAADTPLAVTELVAQNGIAGNWLWWCMAFGGVLTVFFFAPLWRRAGILTDLEFIEVRYSGQAAAMLRGFKSIYFGLFLNSVIMGWVNLAMLKILSVVLPGMSSELILVGILILTATYVSLAGQWGVALTDTFQFIFAMIGTIALAVFALGHDQIGGLANLKAALPASTFNILPSFDFNSNALFILPPMAFITYLTVVWWASWYPGAEPGGGGYIAQRMMSAKNERHAVFATLWFNIAHYCVRPWPWIIVALVSLVLYPDLSATEKGNGFVMVMKDVLPSGWYGLLLAAFLAAYMSTIATHLNWGASYIVNDGIKRFIDIHASSRQLVLYARLSTILLMIFSTLISFYLLETIAGAWKFILDCGAGVGLVLILRWYWWRINAWSEITAMVAPVIFYLIIMNFYPLEFPNSTLVITALTTVTWLVVTFFTKPVPFYQLQQFVATVKPNLAGWKPIVSDQSLPVSDISFFRMGMLWLVASSMIFVSTFLMRDLLFGNMMMMIGWAGIETLLILYLFWDYRRDQWGFLN